MYNFFKEKTGFLTFLYVFTSGIIFFIFFGCHSTGSKNGQVIDLNDRTSMEVFSSTLHSVALPFKDTCFDTVAVQHIKIPDSLTTLKKYGQIIGKINETDNYIAILFSVSGDIQLPVLRTFTHKGELISTLKLYLGNCCGENEDCTGVSTVYIVKSNLTNPTTNIKAPIDLEIRLKDSVQTFERDKKKFEIKRNIKTSVNIEMFELKNTGEIEKTKNLVVCK